jgi:pyruvate/2-oxoglutarate dehydrogenase complex dihydrolipoamide acyltransferase (E2) component
MENINLNSAWRKTAATIYKKPIDSKLLGSVEIDITNLSAYINTQRKIGNKITYSHFFLLATAYVLATEVPQFNTFVKRGNIVSHTDIVAALSVLQSSGDMSTVKIPAAHTLTLGNIASFLENQISETRKGKENEVMDMKNKLGNIPWPFRSMVYGLIRFISINLGLNIPFLNINASSFGSFVLSNIGTLGLDVGFPALLPSANVALVLLMGKPALKPWVVNDKIEPRLIITLSAAIDHRVADASHAGKLFNFYKKAVSNPEILNP